METIIYNLILNRQKMIDAFLGEISPDRGNGHYQISVPRGMFKACNTDTRSEKPEWFQAGNYYDPRAKIDEFSVLSFFNENEIYRMTDFDYSGLTDEEADEVLDINREIIGSWTLSEMETEDYGVGDEIILKVIYKITWE